MLRIPTVLAILGLVFLVSVRADDNAVDFNRDIRPILSNHCFQCHGPDLDQLQADLRLDQREAAIKDLGGHAAIVPENAAASELIARVASTDADLRMPPGDHSEPLTGRQIDLLKRWINQGAHYADHWSFQPVTRFAVPSLPDDAPDHWRSNPIDAFIYRRLHEQGFKPSPPADRSTWIRRVKLDLLGLPPTVDQIAAFIADTSDGAYATMLQWTLENDHFGERWGRHWLDQARYADSHGYTNDNPRTMWPYRDWVIDAFNRDLPFDQFTIEQLAGDLLDNPTLAQRVATGFHRNTLINSEGGTKADQFRDEQVKDRVDTTGLVWMGLTVGCAKCHAHKFDPISQQEYYQLYGFFNSTADSNSVTPTVKVPSPQQSSEIEQLRQRQKDLEQQLARDTERAARQARWEAEMMARGEQTESQEDDFPWTILDLSSKSNRASTKLVNLDDKSVLVGGPGADQEEYQSTARSPLTTIRSVRLELLTDGSLPKRGPGRASNGNFVLSEFWFRTGDGRELRFNKAYADHSQPNYAVTAAIDGKDDSGWAINGSPDGDLNQQRTAWFVLPEPLEVEADHALVFKMQFFVNTGYAIGRYRLSISDQEWIDRPDPGVIAKLLNLAADQRSAEQQARIDKAFIAADPALRNIQFDLDQTIKQIETIERQIPSTMVLQELDKPRPTHLQVRGDFLRLGEQVIADVPAVLPPLPDDATRNRLTLARWLVDDRHPMTARVRVNRIWMRLFGRGLVETENDFGIQGSLPTHPELLDWLASEFMRRGWSTKSLLKLIMSSATYQQQSHHRQDTQTIDPRNLLLARQNRLRVEAEIVRDLALAVSGMMSERIGGPSVYPPQPDGVYAFTQRKMAWNTSTGEDRYRRGMYTFFYRSAPYPMLSTFDVPKFNTSCTRRDRSNTPLQSLTMANSEAMFELTGRLGQRIRSQSDDERERLDFAFRLCLSRSPTDQEAERLERYMHHCRNRWNDDSKVWTAVARVLVNLDEFVTRE